ncbi:GNAT family N-acetyltransferase [Litoreibacter roseus]|uniref:N-acetyltransferase domain-containing protein n=1 Tax=Litoreibacter roseus TaxID=2601869 RepID=A0A6N6JHW1_9RHOB|nr:GNAT family N-acetyltransferase [Litoreibacter roseus]GFE64868.1 hypothetical protein KIN_19420 [Litoreibacter roseus]
MNGTRLKKIRLGVRPASDKDLKELVKLNKIVQGWHAETYPDRFKFESDPKWLHQFFTEKIEADDAGVFVGTANEDVAAYMFFSIVDRPESPITYAIRRLHIEHIVVDPDFRRSGLASALIIAAENVAQDVEATEITLDTWTANTTAKAAFQAMGLIHERSWFAKRL